MTTYTLTAFKHDVIDRGNGITDRKEYRIGIKITAAGSASELNSVTELNFPVFYNIIEGVVTMWDNSTTDNCPVSFPLLQSGMTETELLGFVTLANTLLGGGGGTFPTTLSTSIYTVDGVSYGAGTGLDVLFTELLGTDVASITYSEATGLFTLTHSDGTIETVTLTQETDRVKTVASLTIDAVVYPIGTTLNTILAAIVAAEAANGEFRGIYATAVLVNAVLLPQIGDTARVTDTDTLTGGIALRGGTVHYDGTNWVVYSLDSVVPNSYQFADDTTVSPVTNGAPTAAEIKIWNDALGTPNVDSFIRYTGDDLTGSATTYLFFVDTLGIIELIEKPNGASSIINATVNGARISYEVLTGAPVLTVDRTNPLAPILTAASGTIKLYGFKDLFATASSVNPVYTFNAVWSDVLDAIPNEVSKITASSGQYDTDTTPQVILQNNTVAQCQILFNAISTNMYLTFTWIH